MWQRLLMAMSLEIGWELLENSPIIINRYRETALALGYSGDSIINSVSDTVSMVLGFLVAYRMRIGLVIAIAVTFELFTGYMIHDNLTLNIIQLAYPFKTISAWQSSI